MSSADFPDVSRQNPASVADTDAGDGAPSSNFVDLDLGMSSADLPDVSRENPASVPSSNFADGSRENPATAPGPVYDFDILCEVAEILANREEEERMAAIREEEKRMAYYRYQEEMLRRRAEWKKDLFYKSAKTFALDMHSDFRDDTVPKQRKDEEEDKGKGKSLFMEAKEAIEKRRRRRSISSTTTTSTGGPDLNLTTRREAPTLTDLSLRVLAEHSEAIKSLNLVPDHLKKKLSSLVGDLSRLNTRFMQLLIQDSPSVVSARNCVDLEQKDLVDILCDCDRVSLKVLDLGLCGRAMTELSITEFLKRSQDGFPSLTTLSLQGAFCLTDNALALISSSAPMLRFINLSYCSYLTSHAVKILADNYGSTLRGLNIGGCQGIKPSKVFRTSLSKFEKLNYLSVAGLESIHDGVVEFAISRGSHLTDLSLASCLDVTDRTIWTVGRYCPKLEALDISELDNLTDASLREISDGCRFLNSVKLTKTQFSDEAVAAFLEVCGASLNQLCLDHVRDVGQDTAISLAQSCKRLRYLDLSWCRKLTEDELKRILSCCSLLRSLRLFGWTQVRDEFLEELPRSKLNIVGLKMTSIFDHLDDSYASVGAKFF